MTPREKFREIMADAIDKCSEIECTASERVTGLNQMSDILTDAVILADEIYDEEIAAQIKQNNIVSMSDFRERKRG